jgi:hypothetical protein
MAATGGFDPSFDGADDLDLVFRLVDQGPYVRSDVVTVAYRSHADNWSKDSRAMASGARRVLISNLDRVSAAGDVEAAADLKLFQHWLRPYWTRRVMVDAFTALRSRQFDRAGALALWAIRFSPADAAWIVIRGSARRLLEPLRGLSAKRNTRKPKEN